MKKIIDANFFRNPELTEYLGSDRQNVVIFPDIACMEAYKGDSIKNLSKSLAIVSQFPDQVVILKGVRDVVRLTLLTTDLKQLEDVEQTQGFGVFCLNVDAAQKGDLPLASEIRQLGKEAGAHFEKMLEDSRLTIQGIKMLQTSFTSEELKIIRTGGVFNEDIINKIEKNVLWLTAFLYEKHPDVPIMPEVGQVRQSYVFRFAIAAHLLSLRWIGDGGIGNVNLEKMRNDVIDVNYIAYATYFDGLLTRDNKIMELYNETQIVLERLFP